MDWKIFGDWAVTILFLGFFGFFGEFAIVVFAGTIIWNSIKERKWP